MSNDGQSRFGTEGKLRDTKTTKHSIELNFLDRIRPNTKHAVMIYY